ncbi:MAG: PorT family protein [Flavobacteriaceae bacterium]|nr:PorT family protein [Flavobacteriaceae bacterium]
MKKIILSLVLTICLSQMLHAQAAIVALIFGDKVATENFNIGLELGFPYGSVSSIDHASYKLGLNFGIAGNIKLSEYWSVSPNIYFLSNRNVKTDRFSLNSNNTILNGEFVDVPTEFTVKYIDVPIFFNYFFAEKPFKIGLAPQISFRTDAHADFSNDEGDFNFGIKKHTESIDYGFIAQVGYILGKGGQGKEMHIQLRYYQGLADVFKNDYISGSNKASYFSVHLSLPFIKKQE